MSAACIQTRIIAVALLVILTAVFAPSAAFASLSDPGKRHGKSSPVHVRHDLGGDVIEYMRDVSRLRMAGTQVVISGRCDSACTLLLSLPSELICIKGNATFGFHKAYGGSADMNEWATNMMWKSYPAWVQQWLKSRGGIRKDITRMSFERASTHVRLCDRAARGN